LKQDIRWKQRFQNFEKAFLQLQRFIEKEDLNEFEEQGLIKCFEYTYELAWNLMKDYLVYQGNVGMTGSRDAIRQAFNKELIAQGDEWMRMVDDRIQTVHTYNEDIASEIQERILNVYFFLFEDFYNHMKKLL
jgi:nucleotidyltransferase substrate binding protein (TIGR01987 family)